MLEFLSALTPLVGKAMGGTSAPAGPSYASGAVYGSGLDSSGWVVNFSGVQTGVGTSKTADAGALSSATGIPTWLLLAAAGALAAIFIYKKKA